MILKNYSEFRAKDPNNPLVIDDIMPLKEVIEGLNKIIKNKMNLDLLPSTFINFTRKLNEIIGGDKFTQHENIFIEFRVKEDLEGYTPGEIRETLNFDFEYKIYIMDKDQDYHTTYEIYIAYNLKDMLESNIGKSLSGINKYKL